MEKTKKFILSFPENIADKPFVYHLVKDHNLIVNIFSGKITITGKGFMAVAVTGTEQDILNGKHFLEKSGVLVADGEGVVKYGAQKCTHCGKCTSMCKALILNRKNWLVEFDEEKCTVCGFCIKSCPLGAMSTNLKED